MKANLNWLMQEDDDPDHGVDKDHLNVNNSIFISKCGTSPFDRFSPVL